MSCHFYRSVKMCPEGDFNPEPLFKLSTFYQVSILEKYSGPISLRQPFWQRHLFYYLLHLYRINRKNGTPINIGQLNFIILTHSWWLAKKSYEFKFLRMKKIPGLNFNSYSSNNSKIFFKIIKMYNELPIINHPSLFHEKDTHKKKTPNE